MGGELGPVEAPPTSPAKFRCVVDCGELVENEDVGTVKVGGVVRRKSIRMMLRLMMMMMVMMMVMLLMMMAMMTMMMTMRTIRFHGPAAASVATPMDPAKLR